MLEESKKRVQRLESREFLSEIKEERDMAREGQQKAEIEKEKLKMLMALELGGDENNFDAVEERLNAIRCAPGKRSDGHKYVECPECEPGNWMRLGHYLRHWRAKHDPRKDKKPKLEKAVHRCEDCEYETTHRATLDRHRRGGC